MCTRETKLILILKGSKEIIESKLKIVLSKVTFEVFRHREFKNDSYIEIKEKIK